MENNIQEELIRQIREEAGREQDALKGEAAFDDDSESLQAQMAKEIREEVHSQMINDMSAQAKDELARQIRNDLKAEYTEQVREDIRKQEAGRIREEIRQELEEETRREIRQELEGQIREEVRQELEEEFRGEIAGRAGAAMPDEKQDSADTSGSESSEPMACLVRTKAGEVIGLGVNAFVLGKMEDCCDYVIPGNSSVSRIHAIIRYSEKTGNYFIVDCNATNHVFLDGWQIPPERPVTLEDGMHIHLATEEFIFRLNK